MRIPKHHPSTKCFPQRHRVSCPLHRVPLLHRSQFHYTCQVVRPTWGSCMFHRLPIHPSCPWLSLAASRQDPGLTWSPSSFHLNSLDLESGSYKEHKEEPGITFAFCRQVHGTERKGQGFAKSNPSPTLQTPGFPSPIVQLGWQLPAV